MADTEPTGHAAPVLQRLIITRPAEEAADWVRRLQAAGWPALALPLICVGEPRHPSAWAALHQHRAQWSAFDALMFVSGAAVRHFFAGDALPRADADNRTRFWAPGPGTAQALRSPLAALGLPPDRIDAPAADAAQFDSEALWPVVAPQLRPGSRILVVRGASEADGAGAPHAQGHGRDWLMQQCEHAGAWVQAVAAYERHAPGWGNHELALAQLGQAAGSVWLFSSSQAVEHLLAAQPLADWTRVQALATHPRIAQRAQRAGFGQVWQTRPAFDDVVRALESRWSRP